MEEITERLEKLIEKPKKADPQPEEFYEQHMRGYTMTSESLWIETNNNPTGHRVGHRAVSAVSMAMGVDRVTASALPAKNAYQIVTASDDKLLHTKFRGVYELKRPPPWAG